MFKDGVYIPDRLFGDDELVDFMLMYKERDKEVCIESSDDLHAYIESRKEKEKCLV